MVCPDLVIANPTRGMEQAIFPVRGQAPSAQSMAVWHNSPARANGLYANLRVPLNPGSGNFKGDIGLSQSVLE